MAIWVGQDGSWNDDDGDGAAVVDESGVPVVYYDDGSSEYWGDPVQTALPAGVVFEEFFQQPAAVFTTDIWQRAPRFWREVRAPHHHHEVHEARRARVERDRAHPSAPAHHEQAKPQHPSQQPPQHPQQSGHHTSGNVVGWTEPFTDWEGDLLTGPGQYYVYNITAPWGPATYPSPEVPPAGIVEPNSVDALSFGAPAVPYPPPPPLYTGPPPGAWTPDGGGGGAPSGPTPPSFTSRRPPSPRRGGPGGGGGAPPRALVNGAFTVGWDYPLTDDDGQPLTESHPSFVEHDKPMTYGDPVVTGWDTPLTDAYGQLLSGPGQYGTFTVEDPHDHRTFDDVALSRFDLSDQPFYYYTGQDVDLGAIGQALGSAFGGSGGGSMGGDLGSAIQGASDSGDWGSALASIGSAAAKVAVPLIARAAQGGGAGGGGALPPTQPQTQVQTTSPPPPQQQQQHARRPMAQQRQKLLAVLSQLATKYGISQQAH